MGEMNPKAFFAELKRRNVFKVAIAYGVIAWLLIEVASVLLSEFEERTTALTTLIVILGLGFAVAMFISWSFEMTPQGMKRTADVSPGEVIPYWSKRKFAIFIISTALLAAGLTVFDLVRNRSKLVPPPPTTRP